MKPPEYLGHMRSHYAAIRVDLINDHHMQPGQKWRPFAMMSQQRQMQHIRIGDDHVGRGFPDAFAAIGGCIPVVDGSRWPEGRQIGRQGLKGLQLVLGQRLQGEDI